VRKVERTVALCFGIGKNGALAGWLFVDKEVVDCSSGNRIASGRARYGFAVCTPWRAFSYRESANARSVARDSAAWWPYTRRLLQRAATCSASQERRPHDCKMS
jgi:hypothetical protein